MSFQPVPQTAEVRITYSQDLSDRQYVNLAYFRTATAWDAASIQALATQAVTRFVTSLLPDSMPLGAAVEEIRARDLTSEFGPSAIGVGTPINGTAASAPAPPNNAIMVRFLPDVPPPRRGGVFWPFVFESDVNPVGEVLAAARNTVESRWRSFLEGLELAVPSNHVIVSRFAATVLRPQGVTAQVTRYEALRRVASQRDRRATLSGF